MKNVFVLAFIVIAAIFSCHSNGGAANNGYDIKGKLTGGGGKTIFLDKLTLGTATPTDTAIISNDGSFEMKGPISEKGLYLLRITQDKTWLVLMDKGTVDFTADFDNAYEYQIKGLPENTALTKFVKTVGTKNGQMAKLNQDFVQARTNKASDQELMGLQNQYQVLANQMQADIMTFADTVSSSILSSFAGSLINAEQNGPFLVKLVDKLQKKDPKNSYVAELAVKVGQATRLNEGNIAPEIEAKNPKGETIKLSSLRGKIVLLDFWASWCRPCRMENPNVVEAYTKYKDKGFTVFSVSLDDNVQSWVQAIKQDGLSWETHASDLKKWNSEIAHQWNIQSIPSSFLIDKDGKIIAKNLRGQDLENKLAELLGS